MPEGYPSPTRIHTMYTFGKHERLCSSTLIDELYRSGYKFMLFPYSIRWMPVRSDTLPADTPVQVITNTSKKKFHHAVDRNRVKRLTRECYRLHKNELYAFLQDNDAAIVLSLNYIHTSILKYETLYHKFDKLIPRLMEEIAYQLSGDHATDVEHTM